MPTALIKHQLGDKNLHGAMLMLQQMEQHPDPEVHPTIVTYTTFLSGIARQSLPPDQARATMKFLVEGIKRRDLPMDSRAYTILIRSSMETGEAQGLEDALGYFREMVEDGVPLLANTWYYLLAGLIARKEWGLAKEVLSQVEQD